MKQQYTKQLTSITFSTTDRFSFICIKPRRTRLWTSSDKQRTVKSNRTLITGHASFWCIKSSATWHRGIALYSAPREDIMSTTLINKTNFSGIKLMPVRLPYMSHEPIKDDGTTSLTCLTLLMWLLQFIMLTWIICHGITFFSCMKCSFTSSYMIHLDFSIHVVKSCEWWPLWVNKTLHGLTVGQLAAWLSNIQPICTNEWNGPARRAVRWPSDICSLSALQCNLTPICMNTCSWMKQCTDD